MKIITLDEVQAAVMAVIATAPADYIYPYSMSPGQKINGQCAYQHGGAPSCIVGQALVQLGLPIRVLRKLDVETDSSIGQPGILSLLLLEGIRFVGSDCVIYLAKLQAHQDSGATWQASDASARDPLETLSIATRDPIDQWFEMNPLPEQIGTRNA